MASIISLSVKQFLYQYDIHLFLESFIIIIENNPDIKILVLLILSLANND